MGFCYVWTGNTPPTEAPDNLLVGELYDFNRNPDGEFFSYSGAYKSKGANIGRDFSAAAKARHTGANNPTNSPDVHGQFVVSIRELMKGKDKILKNYYKQPISVAASCIYLPPHAIYYPENNLKIQKAIEENQESDFLPEERQKPKHAPKAESHSITHSDHHSWIGIFRGNVIAPRSKTFRFFGAADDAIVVRFNNELVLETGTFRFSLYRGNGIQDPACDYKNIPEYQKQVAEGRCKDKKGYVVRKLRSTPHCNELFMGVTGGKPVKVVEGETYPIEIIVGNNGGATLLYLLTQEVTPDNDAPLQLFRTTSDIPAKIHGMSSFKYEKGVDFDDNSEIWKVAKESSKTSKKKKKNGGKQRFRKL